MAERTEYAVFRFVDQNGYCHMVNDYVKGQTVMQYVKEGRPVSKQCFWRWCADLLHQLEQYYKWEDEKAYGSINPYAVIVANSGGVMLLDPADSDSQELVKRMQKRNVRVLFVRWEHVLSRKADRWDDSYGLGKTLQFMAEKCRIEHAFTRKEKRSFRKVIDRCLEGKAADVKGLKGLQRELKALGEPKAREKGETQGGVTRSLEAGENGRTAGRFRMARRGGVCFAVAVTVVLAVGMLWWREGRAKNTSTRKEGTLNRGRGETEESGKQAETGQSGISAQGELEGKASEGSSAAWEARLWLELGLLYCGEMEEYELGMEYLETAAETFPLAKAYLTMEIYIQKGGDENQIERALERAVETGREELEIEAKSGWIEGKEYVYTIPFLEAYRILDTEQGWKRAVEEAEKLNETASWGNGEDAKEKEQNIKEYLAKAYEALGEAEKAAAEYERVKELESDAAGLEVLYLKLEDLYEEMNDEENAWKICRESVERVPGSERIWVRYLERHLSDSGIERTLCEEAVKKALEESPGLAQNSEFQKLETEYEIKIEGEEVWIEE